jgi:hypothetical protein
MLRRQRRDESSIAKASGWLQSHPTTTLGTMR